MIIFYANSIYAKESLETNLVKAKHKQDKTEYNRSNPEGRQEQGSSERRARGVYSDEEEGNKKERRGERRSRGVEPDDEAEGENSLRTRQDEERQEESFRRQELREEYRQNIIDMEEEFKKKRAEMRKEYHRKAEK